MASNRPASADTEAASACMATRSADSRVTLGVALHAKRRVALREHLIIHRSVWIVANRATIASGFMLKGEGASLLSVTLHTTIVHPFQLGATGGMRIVTVGTAHFAVQHRVGVWQHELSLLIKVTLEAGIGIFV